jgi:hypothetical protein
MHTRQVTVASRLDPGVGKTHGFGPQPPGLAAVRRGNAVHVRVQRGEGVDQFLVTGARPLAL